MLALGSAERKQTRTELLESLTDGRRRRALAILADRAQTVTVRELAAHVVAAERDASVETVPREAVEETRVELRHLHLPKLDASDLVAWDEADGLVAPVDRPVFDDPDFRTLLDAEGDDWDAIIETFANERRRTVLTALDSLEGTVSRDVLANEIADREHEDPSPEAIAKVRRRLHHVDLPKLDSAGLVDYDREEETVAYRNRSELSDLPVGQTSA